MALAFILPLNVAKASLINFSIEKNVFNEMNKSQQNAITERVQDLNHFFETKVLPLIPQNIKEKISQLEVTIHLSDKSGRDGLFIPGIEDHKHKIVIQLMALNSNGIKSLLAHEFFHAIHFEINPDEETWIREGMAQLFEYIITKEFNGNNFRAAILNPLTPLIGKYEITNINAAQYGHNMLYFFYLYNHCGGSDFFWSLTEGKNNLQGTALIDSLLGQLNSKKSECKNFTDSAISFEVAKSHNQIQESTDIAKEAKERFFLAPTNLSPKFPSPHESSELTETIKMIPLYSSFKMKLPTFIEQKGHCSNCKIFYAKNKFPYDVTEILPNENSKNYDVILVKTSDDPSAD